MDGEIFADHLANPRGAGRLRTSPNSGSAGGAACGDVVDFRVELRADGTVAAGFDASGCGALTATASAIVEAVEGLDVLDAARLSTASASEGVGGLSAAKIHAAELCVDAFHRALGSAAAGARSAQVAGRRLVALSGGVDSAVAAALSADRGEVVGVTLELWRDGRNDAASSCCSHVAVRRARSIAHEAGLPHFTLDLRDAFRSGVVDPWLEGHASGVTPNPCVQCNGRVRIEPMLDLARSIGAERLVTGHYARLVEVEHPDGPLLAEGGDPLKDQAYALSRVPARVLANMEFPLAGMTKTQVREIARERGLPVADTPDSQDLCFLAGVGKSRFIAEHGERLAGPGDLVDVSGIRVGTHRGLHEHTIGQRRGLGIGGGVPLYVVDVDPASNSVTVGPRERLLTTSVRVVDVDLRRTPDRVRSARLRHRARAGAVSHVDVDRDGTGATIHFAEPVERVAPGQVACLLDGDRVVGCATVARDAA